jgi:phage terminase small subunit
MAKKATELTPKQAQFVREYMIDRNGTQAAIRAGYSAKSARDIATENLSKPLVAAAIAAATAKVAQETETEADWVRRRLREEANDFSEFSSHSARIRAIELLGKINGVFEVDNKQKASPLEDFAKAVLGNVAGPGPLTIPEDDD